MNSATQARLAEQRALALESFTTAETWRAHTNRLRALIGLAPR